MAQLRGYVRGMVIVVMLAIRVSLPAGAEIISESVPFVSPKGGYVTHEEGYHTFRIPGMIVTQDGSVLVFAEGRRGDGSDPRRDENAPIDLVMRRSTDNGRTWQPMVVIDSGFRPSGDLLDFSDPTPVLDSKTGTVFLFYDEGKTFTNPVQINHGFAAYSVMQRLADGTIGMVVETAKGAADRYGEITFYRFDLAELEGGSRRR